MTPEREGADESTVGDQLDYYRKVVDRLPGWIREATQRYLCLNAGGAVGDRAVEDRPGADVGGPTEELAS